MAITPDQTPTARFKSMTNGPEVTFDASASSSPIGSIALYAWDFGDGQTTTTRSPTILHGYKVGGTFEVTLKVTNTAGTSTALTFTGQTASNNGGPSAKATQTITIQNIGVDNFKGKVHRSRKQKKLFLKTQWTKSLIPNAKAYKIFKRNEKITTVKIHNNRRKTICLHPHHLPHSLSKDYKQYLNHKYNIRVVNATGGISEPTFIHVKGH